MLINAVIAVVLIAYYLWELASGKIKVNKDVAYPTGLINLLHRKRSSLTALLCEAKASVVASNAPPRCPLARKRRTLELELEVELKFESRMKRLSAPLVCNQEELSHGD